MFARPADGDPLTQGDLIDDCPLVGLNLASSPLDLNDPATTIVFGAQSGSLALACGHPSE